MMMNKTLAAAIALALCSAATVALAAQPQAERPARATLDANGDGAIDRAEAAKHPRFARHFDRMDKDGDGRIDASERPHRHGMKHGRHRGGVERLDTDGDGRISRAEAAVKTAHAGRNRLVDNFDAIDANRDGHVVRSELQAWHERQRPQREAEMRKRFDARFAGADLNRDGKLSRVEVDEKMPRLAKRFAWMDDDRDGFLSRGELQPSRGR